MGEVSRGKTRLLSHQLKSLLDVSDSDLILTFYFWIAGFVVTMGKSP